MDYGQARSYIEKLSRRGSVPGLDAVRELLGRLGNPQDDLKFIHIAGTNGKGSVLSYLSGVLTEAGWKTGRYISPTLFSYRERIQVDGEFISREDFAVLTQMAAEAAEEMEAEGIGHPTAFEVETAVSFLYFKEKQCDFVVLETGMGGRLDATNIIKTPVLSVIASISMDHIQFLGKSLGEIAWHKAGIIKEKVPAVSAFQEAEAAAVLKQEAREKRSSLSFVDPEKISQISYGLRTQSFTYKEFEHMEISLAGKYQISNAALALEAVRALRGLGYKVEEEALRRGLKGARWRGRFEVLTERPWVVLDGAHNPDAAVKLIDSVGEYFKERKKYYIFGVFSDKEYDKIIDITAKDACRIFTVETPDNPRALPAGELAGAVKRVNPRVEAAESIPDAVRKCFSLAGCEDVILIFGSLSFLGEARKAVESISRR
ncbi:MAG TPA: bifunctional folylpolyglutamate synthase/dihydrofolate synthase [Candidatus Choladousia intestinavium]|uniref:tetrahydrofolate synthase n=1 Tax=Candidatus Choladousia intestinavium TaxID=2840727 RepID=A0A9D1ACT9_9FIRM|nr:bifunctional folylpolyglutamate synthase/dihydrofolate synthase [Candidatus Choladousia intestinavium]